MATAANPVRAWLGQAWLLYGLKPKDLVGATISLPAGLTFFSKLFDDLDISDLLSDIVVGWQTFTRNVWTMVFDWLARYITLPFTERDKDFLTLSVLAVLTALIGLLFRGGRKLEGAA